MENHHINTVAADGQSDFLTRVLDSLPAGILLIRADRSIAYANDMFMKLWRVPDDLVRYRKRDMALINHVLNQLVDAPGFIAVVERLYASMETSQDEVVFKDGRVFWRRSYPVLEDDGKVARVWVFADISDIRKSLIETIQAAGQSVATAAGGTDQAEAVDEAQNRKKRGLLGSFKL